eukprot:CAMPEP_0114987554 /NCGR_PEP_ID=MMETSP0216-20121206/9072_1 /TAXON_ID=223996 /ORGANISM="Protocruzia adherens, Strain Boccale" /LENGTH=215 /DNA_ID=CAMNT_0002350165 /DNA_START=53 /DNA_END=697 /DNA_ORIENTATION=-
MAEKKKVHYDENVKVLLLGDGGVGKSSVLTRFAEGKYNSNFVATIGVDFKMKIIDIEGKKVRIQVWDTAGQERFRTITPAYYRSVMGVILVYDITDAQSYENVDYWMKNLEDHASPHISKLLIGNKSDLTEARTVDYEKGKALADGYGIKFIECSAKTSENVIEAFKIIASDIIEKGNSTGQDKGGFKPKGEKKPKKEELLLKLARCVVFQQMKW